MAKRYRAGSKWRVLAQAGEGRAELRDVFEFDELAVDRWLHIERMSDKSWWMQLGGLYVWIVLKPNGDVDISIRGREYRDIGGRVTIESVVVDEPVPAVPLVTGVSGWRVPTTAIQPETIGT